MGNSQSTSQKIAQIIENYTEATAESNASASCTQNISVDFSGSLITGGCSGIQLNQVCSSASNASLDTVVKALQSATLDSESTQTAEGLAVSANVSKTDNNMITKTLNSLVANCKSNANSVASQSHIYLMRNMVIDCSENPDANIINVSQYNDADAACVVKQIVDSQQQNSASAKTTQENIGLGFPDFGACLGVIALVILAPVLIPGLMPGGKKKGNLENLLKNL
uniref:Uncharacterized protein n=1 Tax=viral metagenome TaxID=1070528 RepID=A0A6C0IYC1_9ZZZZ